MHIQGAPPEQIAHRPGEEEFKLTTTKERFVVCGPLCWLHDSLFSLNVALLILPVALIRMKSPILMRGRDIVDFLYRYWPFWIPANLKNSEPNRQYFAALVLVIGIVIFLLLRATARFSSTSRFLQLFALAVALAGLPLVRHVLQNVPWPLFLELSAILLCATLIVTDRWNLPPAIAILALALHFGLWSWGIYPNMWLGWAYPILGFASATVSGISIRSKGRWRTRSESSKTE